MPNKCCALNCKFGIQNDSEDKENLMLSFHRFPLHNAIQLDKWLEALQRIEFAPSKNSRLCSLHFDNDDFVNESCDKRNRTQIIRKRKLKATAVPKHFLGSKAVSSVDSVAKVNASNCYANHQNTDYNSQNVSESKKVKLLGNINHVNNIGKSDVVKSLDELLERLEEEKPPEIGEFVSKRLDNNVLYILLDLENEVPYVVCSVLFKQSLEVTVTNGNKVVGKDAYSHLLSNGRICSFANALKLLDLLKSIKVDSIDLQRYVACAMDAIDNAIYISTDELVTRKLDFVNEQLHLILKVKNNRRYSQQLTVWSLICYSISPSCYQSIVNDDVLCVPSVSTIRRLISKVPCKSEESTSSYLKQRIANLNDYERLVLLMVDEIYVNKKLEFCGGTFFGILDDGSCAGTIVSFMIKSVCGKYKDMVALYPASKLTASQLHEYFINTLQLLTQCGFTVVALSVDNAAVNRSFFVKYLCNGNLSTRFTNPFSSEPIYLLFDPTHNLKNIYNNLQSRKVFHCPSFRDNESSFIVDFNHIEQLYHIEKLKPLKLAHKLKACVFNPKSIEKTSTKFASSIFHESTCNALKFYANFLGKQWSGTVQFLEIINKLWCILNVKSPYKGFHKRDVTQNPIYTILDVRFVFLTQMSDFLLRWSQSGLPGLSKETNTAVRHTILVLIDLCHYLLQEKRFYYIMLGAFQSDDLEQRFGWYRQLSGGNYNISVRQVFESERKIKINSLAKFSCITMNFQEDFFLNNTLTNHDDTLAAARCFADKITSLSNLFDFDDGDYAVAFYVAGYASNVIRKTVQCQFCISLFVGCFETPVTPPVFEAGCDKTLAERFMQQVNRGGLVYPSNSVFNLCLMCCFVFSSITQDAALKVKLLAHPKPRMLFVEIMCLVLEQNDLLYDYANATCSSYHSTNLLNKRVIAVLFNCLANNLIKEVNATATTSSGNSGIKRKIAKLNSM